MSRLKNYTRSMMSSYSALAVAVLYNLAAVPLALHYLSKAEFGLWALTLQIAGYIALIDLGMGSSVTRILIDHKDNRTSGHYGGVIQSGFWVGAAQAAIILAVGFSLKEIPTRHIATPKSGSPLSLASAHRSSAANDQ